MTLREAANKLGKATLAYGSGFDDSPIGCAVALACAWMQEHPADDDEPVTHAWVKTIGFAETDHLNKMTYRRPESIDLGLWAVDGGWKAMLLITEFASSTITRGLKTRGQVRRLLSALGIEHQRKGSEG
jgi:hypothetical protein